MTKRLPEDPRADVARELFEAFRMGRGIFGRTHLHMPEFVRTVNVKKEDLVNFLTVTATLDYQTDAEALWLAAEATYLDPHTRWLFDMPAVANISLDAMQEAMQIHGFTGRYQTNNANYLQRVCTTFASRYGGSPNGLLEAHRHDALSLYENRRRLGDLPALTGEKIFPFWLRILKDIASIQLLNIEKVPLPVDVHTARATYRLVYHRMDRPTPDEDRERVIQDWFKICRSVGDPAIYPLTLDEPLWLLSRNGCSGTDGKDGCARLKDCVVARYCVFFQHSFAGGAA